MLGTGGGTLSYSDLYMNHIIDIISIIWLAAREGNRLTGLMTVNNKTRECAVREESTIQSKQTTFRISKVSIM